MTNEEFKVIKVVFIETLKKLEDEDEETLDKLWKQFLSLDRSKYEDPDYDKIFVLGSKKKFLTTEELDDHIYDKVLQIYKRILDCEESFNKYMIV